MKKVRESSKSNQRDRTFTVESKWKKEGTLAGTFMTFPSHFTEWRRRNQNLNWYVPSLQTRTVTSLSWFNLLILTLTTPFPVRAYSLLLEWTDLDPSPPPKVSPFHFLNLLRRFHHFISFMILNCQERLKQQERVNTLEESIRLNCQERRKIPSWSSPYGFTISFPSPSCPYFLFFDSVTRL